MRFSLVVAAVIATTFALAAILMVGPATASPYGSAATFLSLSSPIESFRAGAIPAERNHSPQVRTVSYTEPLQTSSDPTQNSVQEGFTGIPEGVRHVIHI